MRAMKVCMKDVANGVKCGVLGWVKNEYFKVI